MWPSAGIGPARLLLRAGAARLAPAGWGTVASAAVVLAFSTASHTDWAMARGESLRQRCSFVATMLAVGLKLWFTRRDAGRDHDARLIA